LREQCRTAQEAARFLEAHGAVESVIYPGLESHPQHELARRQMNGGFGSLLAFRVGAGQERAFEVMNRLRLIAISNNLGDAKSLITHPTTTTHQRLTVAEREALGISDDLVRLSVGLEAAEDLMQDLDQALRG
jgi:O-succinylhomoserine sulfhydrylase